MNPVTFDMSDYEEFDLDIPEEKTSNTQCKEQVKKAQVEGVAIGIAGIGALAFLTTVVLPIVGGISAITLAGAVVMTAGQREQERRANCK